MKYSIKQLADASGVSTRTLRFYDENGLLPPAYYGENGYRFYQEKELLRLQQILFFRELGFSLSEIKLVIAAEDFNQVLALKKHKTLLKEKIESYKSLIKTIDKTLVHLTGEMTMNEKDYYLGFKSKEQHEALDRLYDYLGNRGRDIMQQYITNNPDALDDKKTDERQSEIDFWVNKFKDALEDGFEPTGDVVQKIVQEYYDAKIKPYCDMTPKEFAVMFKAEQSHPKSMEMYNAVHPEMAQYVMKAVNYFAENN